MLRALAAAVVLAILLADSAPVLADTEIEDITAPQIVSAIVEPSVINTSNAPVTLTLTVHVTDDLSGFKEDWLTVDIRLVPDNPNASGQFVDASLYYHSDRCTGTVTNSVCTVTLVVPQYSAGGRWSPQQIHACDAIRNCSHVAFDNVTPSTPGYVTFLNDTESVSEIQHVFVPMIARNSPYTADPCVWIGGDGCKFKVRDGPAFAYNDGNELVLQLLFVDSGIDGGQPQGSYFVAMSKDSVKLPILDSVRSIALYKSDGALGAYNYEYKLSLADIPGNSVAGNYVMFVRDGNGARVQPGFWF